MCCKLCHISITLSPTSLTCILTSPYSFFLWRLCSVNDTCFSVKVTSYIVDTHVSVYEHYWSLPCIYYSTWIEYMYKLFPYFKCLCVYCWYKDVRFSNDAHCMQLNVLPVSWICYTEDWELLSMVEYLVFIYFMTRCLVY